MCEEGSTLSQQILKKKRLGASAKAPCLFSSCCLSKRVEPSLHTNTKALKPDAKLAFQCGMTEKVSKPFLLSSPPSRGPVATPRRPWHLPEPRSTQRWIWDLGNAREARPATAHSTGNYRQWRRVAVVFNPPYSLPAEWLDPSPMPGLSTPTCSVPISGSDPGGLSPTPNDYCVTCNWMSKLKLLRRKEAFVFLVEYLWWPFTSYCTYVKEASLELSLKVKSEGWVSDKRIH